MTRSHALSALNKLRIATCPILTIPFATSHSSTSSSPTPSSPPTSSSAQAHAPPRASRKSVIEVPADARRPMRGVHVFHCQDRLGVVAGIADCVASGGANILSADLHIDAQADPPMFYSRSEFAFHPQEWPRSAMEKDFGELAKKLNAKKSFLHVPGFDPNLKMAILASWQDHCLVDLLYRWQEGELPVDIVCVISNHERDPNSHVRRFLQRHGIPYHHVAATRADRREADLLSLVSSAHCQTDFLVLARYMQVLSPWFLASYGRDIINIHHGLLPSFKGANPYRQAHESGVKLIGATSHFVTEELDDGPIIEQLVDRVSHRDTLPAFASKSEILEKQCLARAVKYFCEHRIVRYSNNKTLVFA